MSTEALTALAVAIVGDLDELRPVDASTVLTLAVAIILHASGKTEPEQAADLFRNALLDQIYRMQGRRTLGGGPAL